jgi:hypothetical protein
MGNLKGDLPTDVTALRKMVVELRAELVQAQAEIRRQCAEIKVLKTKLTERPTEPTAPQPDDPERVHRLIRAVHDATAGSLDGRLIGALDRLATDVFGSTAMSEQLRFIASIVTGLAAGEAWYGSSTARKADLAALARNLARVESGFRRLNYRTQLALITPPSSSFAALEPHAATPTADSTKLLFERTAALHLVRETLGEIRKQAARVAESETPRPRGRPGIADPVGFGIEMLAESWVGRTQQPVTGSRNAGQFGDLVHRFFAALELPVAPPATVATALRAFVAKNGGTAPKE